MSCIFCVSNGYIRFNVVQCTHVSSQPTTQLEGYVPNVSTLRNHIICGYQGWFAYPGDGAPINKWKHWFSHPTEPSAEHLEVDMYPYMDEYDDEDLMESNMKHRDGSNVRFFSSARLNVVKKHFEWMRDYGEVLLATRSSFKSVFFS